MARAHAAAGAAIAIGVFLAVNPVWQMAPLHTARQVAAWEHEVRERFPPGDARHLSAAGTLTVSLVGTKPGPVEYASVAAGALALVLWLVRRELRSSRALAPLVCYALAAVAATALWLPGPIERWVIGSTTAVWALAACAPTMIRQTFRRPPRGERLAARESGGYTHSRRPRRASHL